VEFSCDIKVIKINITPIHISTNESIKVKYLLEFLSVENVCIYFQSLKKIFFSKRRTHIDLTLISYSRHNEITNTQKLFSIYIGYIDIFKDILLSLRILCIIDMYTNVIFNTKYPLNIEAFKLFHTL